MFLKKTTCLLFLILLGMVLNAQTAKDSLLSVLKNRPQKDSIKCELIYKIILLEDETIDRNFFLNELQSISIINLKNNNPKSVYYKYLGLYHYEKGYDALQETKLDQAYNMFDKAFYFHSKIKYNIGIADDLNYKGIVNISQGKYTNAADNLLQAKKYYQQAKNNIGLQNTLFNLSQVYLKLENFDNAANSLIEAIKIAESEKDDIGISDIYDQLGTIYIMQNELEKASYYFKKGLKLKQQINYKKSLATSYRNLGIVSFKKKQFEKGLNYFEQAYTFVTNKLQTKAIHTSKGIMLFEMGNYLESEKFLKNALLDNETDNAKGNIYPILSQIYFKLGNFKNAEKYGLLGFELTKKNKFLDKQFEAAYSLYLIYKQKNEIIKSYQFLEISSSLKDSINRKENKNAMLKADFKYETEKKEAKIKELDQKKKIAELQSNKKTILINSFIISFLALAIIAYFLFSRFKTQKKNELLETKLAEAEKLLEAEKKATDSELKALKSQMNPHFIFNALNSIQEQFMYGDKLKGNEQLSNFTYLTRQILEVSGKKQITIATEVDILTKYLDLEKMRFAKDFEYKITIAPTIDEDYHKLPPMLLQPFVENSIKHGLMHKNGLKMLSIDFNLSSNEEYLICTIQDNGIGRKKSAEIKANNQVKHNSFSTQSIEERLHLLNEKLQLNDLIVYTDVAENGEVIGTKVVIKIPLV